MKRRTCCAIMAGAISLALLSSCSTTSEVDFIAEFDEGKISPQTQFGTPTGKAAFVVPKYPIAGEKRDAIITLATGEIAFEIDSVPEQASLTFGAAVSPDSADGAEGVVMVEVDGKRQAIHRKFLDPANREADRKWFDETVDLSSYAGKEITLIFATTMRGNANSDWFIWSNPQLR